LKIENEKWKINGRFAPKYKSGAGGARPQFSTFNFSFSIKKEV
jgi:hypothetical protein